VLYVVAIEFKTELPPAALIEDQVIVPDVIVPTVPLP
jgi:hypothetical protein